MTRDDDTIRRLLADAAPASRGVSAEAVARRAGKAQKRRTALTLITVPVATLAVIGAAVAGVELFRDDASGPVDQPTQTVTDSAGGLVPWVDTRAKAYVAPSPGSSAGSPPPRACTADDLQVAWSHQPPSPTGGDPYYTFLLTNVSSEPCLLDGFGTLVARAADSAPITAADEPSDQLKGGVLTPGAVGSLIFTDGLSCQEGKGSVLYRDFEITLPGGGTLTPPRPREGIDLSCGMRAFPLQVVEESVDPWGDLQVTVDTSSAIVADGFLVYEVDLTNPTAEEISFTDRCPSYVEFLKPASSAGATYSGNYELNCAVVAGIRAGETMRFEMKLSLPAGVNGSYVLQWSVQGPDMPEGASTVVVGDAGQGGTYSYTSPKGVVIKLDDFPSGKAISSPVTITGQVPGSWSFEADFPVVLTDWDGKIIAQGIGTLQGDWMTEDLVPFTVTLKFKTPTYNNTGSLILQKDNPSGEAKFDDAVEIPVTFTDAPAAAGELLDYSDLNDGSGAEVLPDGDISQLAGAPADFVAFIADLAHQTGVTGKDCPDAYHGVHVSKLRSDGFAIGGVNDCGGGIAIWAVVDGSWQQVVFTQEAPQCADLRRYAIPSDIAGGTCYDRSGSLVEYSQP